MTYTEGFGLISVRRMLVNMEKLMKQKRVKPEVIVICCLLLSAVALGSGQPRRPEAPPVAQVETRCGWFSNPTPANASLYDRAGEWIIGVQGGHQAEGDWPDFGPGQWVKTNVNYGYGCACLQVRVNRETREVVEIESARARPLAVCRRDRALKRWGFR
jgi:hypothetical protein